MRAASTEVMAKFEREMALTRLARAFQADGNGSRATVGMEPVDKIRLRKRTPSLSRAMSRSSLSQSNATVGSAPGSRSFSVTEPLEYVRLTQSWIDPRRWPSGCQADFATAEIAMSVGGQPA